VLLPNNSLICLGGFLPPSNSFSALSSSPVLCGVSVTLFAAKATRASNPNLNSALSNLTQARFTQPHTQSSDDEARSPSSFCLFRNRKPAEKHIMVTLEVFNAKIPDYLEAGDMESESREGGRETKFN
jgi:hypothetical protein